MPHMQGRLPAQPRRGCLWVSLVVATVVTNAWAQPAPATQAGRLSGEALAAALRQGGYVLVFRHASSPAALPTTETANADNVTLERQLDAAGRADATALGAALRRLQVPIGDVLVSPLYRAMETARLARLPNPRPEPELGEASGNMAAVTPAQLDWLRKTVAEVPRTGNTILITHSPHIIGAFPADGAAIAQGEAIVFRPSPAGPPVFVARLTIDEWSRLDSPR